MPPDLIPIISPNCVVKYAVQRILAAKSAHDTNNESVLVQKMMRRRRRFTC